MRVGTTSRYGPRNPSPVRHAWTSERASRTGVNHLAVCGASIRPTPRDDLGSFDRDHPRACRTCVAVLAQSDAAVRAHYAGVQP